MTSEKATVFIVDDQKQNIQILAGILGEEYNIRFATSGIEALEKIKNKPLPDIILLDIMMPEMNGYELCKKIKNDSLISKIPVIFVTALNELENEAEGFAVGGVDYITKPVRPSIVKARVATHLALFNQNRALEIMVKQRTKELLLTRDATIYGLAGLAETRDNETGEHIKRTQLYVGVLAQYLYEKTEYAKYLSEEKVDLLAKSAPLHDIGKVGIPDNILLKPGKLTDEEFVIMKTHVDIGRATIERAEKAIGKDMPNTFLASAREICANHHEKYDGSGYPRGLKGQDIPLPGRIMAICDVYDALISRRVYKPPFPHVKAVEIIKKDSGTHFDPILVDAFLTLESEFIKIASENIDDKEDVEILFQK